MKDNRKNLRVYNLCLGSSLLRILFKWFCKDSSLDFLDQRHDLG